MSISVPEAENCVQFFGQPARKRMGRPRSIWTEEMDWVLRKGWGKETKVKLGLRLNVSEKMLRKRACELGLPVYGLTDWTREMDVALRAGWGVVSPEVLCERIGVSRHATYRRAKKLGLPIKPGRHYVKWTDEMDNELLQGWGKVRSRHLAGRIGVSPHTMYDRARELGLPVRNQEKKSTPNSDQRH